MVVKQTEVGTPLDGWKYVVEEWVITCEITGRSESEFYAMRIGAFEYAGRGRHLLGFFLNFEDAKKRAEQARHRSLASGRRQPW